MNEMGKWTKVLINEQMNGRQKTTLSIRKWMNDQKNKRPNKWINERNKEKNWWVNGPNNPKYM